MFYLLPIFVLINRVCWWTSCISSLFLWTLHVSSQSNQTPRTLKALTCLSCYPFNLKVAGTVFHHFEKQITCVLCYRYLKSPLICSIFHMNYCHLRFLIDIRNIATFYPSSAQRDFPTFCSTREKMTFIIMLNNRGLRTLPCGVPFSTVCMLEYSAPVLVNSCQIKNPESNCILSHQFPVVPF